MVKVAAWSLPPLFTEDPDFVGRAEDGQSLLIAVGLEHDYFSQKL